MSDETYPDSLPYEVLDLIGSVITHSTRATLAARAASALGRARSNNYALVRVPDGMSPTDAERILSEHVEWVPLPDGPTEAHVGKRLRCVWDDGRSFVQDKARRVSSWDGVDWAGFTSAGTWIKGSGDWFIHPDDVPRDPDAELIEAMARSLADRRNQPCPGWDRIDPDIQEQYRRDAHAALAVVREHEAGQR